MIKEYSKDNQYSYAIGFFSVIQLLELRKDLFHSLYVQSSSLDTDGYKKILSLISPKDIIISDKAFFKAKVKDNAHVLALFRKEESKLKKDADHLVLVNPSDLGNLGNSYRTALAFQTHDIAVIGQGADIFSPKAIRASMGAFFHLRVKRFKTFEEYISQYPRTYYPFMLNEKAKRLKDIVFESPCSLVFGNEATGLDPSFFSDNAVFIEQSKDVDSLNLTTSIAIALYKKFTLKS